MIPVRWEPDFHWEGRDSEPCCFCRMFTRYWTAMENPHVPCCFACSERREPWQVPGWRAYSDLVAIREARIRNEIERRMQR